MTRVISWDEVETPDKNDALATEHNGNERKVLIKRFMHEVANGGGGNNYIVNPDCNTIHAHSSTSVIAGGGRLDYPNRINSPGMPGGTDYTPWVADALVSDAVTIDAATITGGYDNICNQLAGTISGGGHNFISYNVNGKSVIGGGSYNYIASGFSAILSGLNNTIKGDSFAYATISGGISHLIESSYSIISGGAQNKIQSAGIANSISAGAANQIINASHSCILSGSQNAISGGSASLVAGIKNHISSTGLSNTAFGQLNRIEGNCRSATVIGQSNKTAHDYSLVMGLEAESTNSYQLVQSSGKLDAIGDSQRISVVQKAKTIGVSLNPDSPEVIKLTATTATAGHVMVSGYNETEGTHAAFKIEFAGFYDGKIATINGETEAIITAIHNVSGLPAPVLLIDAGLLRVRFPGAVEKTIRWCAHIDIVMSKL